MAEHADDAARRVEAGGRGIGDAAARRLGQRREHAEQRRLARAVRAEQAEHLAADSLRRRCRAARGAVRTAAPRASRPADRRPAPTTAWRSCEPRDLRCRGARALGIEQRVHAFEVAQHGVALVAQASVAGSPPCSSRCSRPSSAVRCASSCLMRRRRIDGHAERPARCPRRRSSAGHAERRVARPRRVIRQAVDDERQRVAGLAALARCR